MLNGANWVLMGHEGKAAQRKILIVDDQAAMRTLIRRVCTRKGDDVVECSDGSEAVATYASYQPDWVLMDIRMSGIDGLRATAQIKKTDPKARVVIVTQETDKYLQKAATQAGAVAFFNKEDLLQASDFLIRAETQSVTDWPGH